MSTAFDFCKKNEKNPLFRRKGEDVEKLNLHFFKNAEGLGEQKGQHICSANASHKWLSACLAVWSAPNGIPRGKAEVSRLLANGTLHPEENGGSEADFAEQSA